MKTEKIIYKMLTENTGVHMCDSGGDNGRHWQRNQKKKLKDFQKEKYISYDEDYCTKSLFHHLVESCEYLEDETKMLEAWIKQIRGMMSKNLWRNIFIEIKRLIVFIPTMKKMFFHRIFNFFMVAIFIVVI